MSALEVRPRAGEPGVFDVHVPVDLPYFQGHFDGHPILAAVVQLELLVLGQIAATWPELTRLRRLTRVRFQIPIEPGDDIELRIERRGATRVTFEMLRAGAACSSGTLHFAGEADP